MVSRFQWFSLSMSSLSEPISFGVTFVSTTMKQGFGCCVPLPTDASTPPPLHPSTLPRRFHDASAPRRFDASALPPFHASRFINAMPLLQQRAARPSRRLVARGLSRERRPRPCPRHGRRVRAARVDGLPPDERERVHGRRRRGRGLPRDERERLVGLARGERWPRPCPHHT